MLTKRARYLIRSFFLISATTTTLVFTPFSFCALFSHTHFFACPFLSLIDAFTREYVKKRKREKGKQKIH